MTSDAARAPGAAHRARRAAAGFTLVELLIVVAIIGLLAGAVAFSAGGLGDRGPAHEALRLAAAMHRAQEAAVLANRTVALRTDALGYSFEMRGPAGWVPVPDRGLARGVFARDVAALVGDGGVISVVFDNTGAASPAVIVLARGRARVAVAIDGGGKVGIHDAAIF